MCQRDLKPGTKTRSVRVVDIGGGPYSVHPDDETQFDAEGATIVAANGYRDLGQCLIGLDCAKAHGLEWRSEEHTSELQSLMRSSYAVFCLKKKKIPTLKVNL